MLELAGWQRTVRRTNQQTCASNEYYILMLYCILSDFKAIFIFFSVLFLNRTVSLCVRYVLYLVHFCVSKLTKLPGYPTGTGTPATVHNTQSC